MGVPREGREEDLVEIILKLIRDVTLSLSLCREGGSCLSLFLSLSVSPFPARFSQMEREREGVKWREGERQRGRERGGDKEGERGVR